VRPGSAAYGADPQLKKRQEKQMSNSVKGVLALCLVAFVAACGGQRVQQEEFVVVEPEPISIEPTYTGKYK
jgi:hypothetical protein